MSVPLHRGNKSLGEAGGQTGTRWTCWSLPWPPKPTPSPQGPTPGDHARPEPAQPGPRVPTSRSLTLVAVGQEVGTGPQVLPVETVYGDGRILDHLSLEGTHSAGQTQRTPTPSLQAEVSTAPLLPGTCRRRAIGRPGAAVPNQSSLAVGPASRVPRFKGLKVRGAPASGVPAAIPSAAANPEWFRPEASTQRRRISAELQPGSAQEQEREGKQHHEDCKRNTI